jgi:hypothetical protein
MKKALLLGVKNKFRQILTILHTKIFHYAFSKSIAQ